MVTVQRVFFFLVFGLTLSASIPSAFGNTLYISHAGGGDGSSCSSPQSYSYFNSPSNWSSSPSGTKIGPGTTVHGCAETYNDPNAGDTALIFQCGTANGTNGNPITLTFDQGSTNLYNSNYWSGINGAIGNSGNCSYVTINGNNNLTIANQNPSGSPVNGTGLANEQTSYGIQLGSCSNCIIENMNVSNIYVNNGSGSGASNINGQFSGCIVINGSATGSTISGNTVSQCKTGITVSADPGKDASNLTISNNNISDMDWGIEVGGGDSGDTIYNLVVHDNNITNWTNWQFPTSTYHQDGIIVFNYATGSATLTATLYNNYLYGDLGVGSPTGFIFCSHNSQCTVYNNLLVNTGHVIYGIMWLDTHMGGHKVYNNTIVGLSSDSAITLGTSTGTNVNSPIVVENNIVVGPGVGINDYSTLTSDVSVSDHNIWRNSSGSAPQMTSGGSAFIPYSTWLKDGYDGDSTNNDPDLDGTYHLQSGSPATGLAANLTALNVAPLDLDKALNPRPSSIPTNWDAGVYNASGGSTPAAPTGLAASVQ